MKEIRTKETVRDIRLFDKTSGALRNVKKASVRTKDGYKDLPDNGQLSPSEYAEDRVQYAAEDALRAAYGKASGRIRKGRDRVREALKEKRTENRLARQKKRVDRKIGKIEKAQAKEGSNRNLKSEAGCFPGRRVGGMGGSGKGLAAGTENIAKENHEMQEAVFRPRRFLYTAGSGIGTAENGRGFRSTAGSLEKAGVTSAGPRIKTAERSVKTAERSLKRAVKTAKDSAENAPKSAKTAIRTARMTVSAAKKAAVLIGKATVVAAEAAAIAVIAAGKAVLSAVTALAALLGMGGAVSLAVIIILGSIAMIFGSAGGIFFSNVDTGGKSMESVVHEINAEYSDRLAHIKEVNTYDEVSMSGSSAVWREVLSYYAVKTSMDEEAAQEVVTLDDEKVELLKEIFWEMNTISSEVKTETKIVIEEVIDEHGDVIEVEVEKEITTLYIKVSHLTADEMATKHGLSEKQKDMMHALLSDEYRSLWDAVLYGIKSGETAIIEVAASQIGNVGGEPYWSMFGFTSRIEWCVCFVSWCGNECGYIENGIMPYSIGCVPSMNWYKERGQWTDGNEEPLPGMIIFYDWDDPAGEFGPQDGKPDHTGIVEKVVDGVIWTIEGNSGDSCRRNQHPVGEHVIMGYGVPKY